MSPDERDLHLRASVELEQRCDFAGAAREALAGDDVRRAVHLAALAGDSAMIERALTALAQTTPEIQRAAASDLSARGFPGVAGRALGALGAHAEAAAAYAQAGDAITASDHFEAAGKPIEGAKALENAIRRTPDAGRLHLALGRLLCRHGRLEAASRAFQRIEIGAPERRAALPELARCLDGLGLNEAAREVRDELRALGGEETAVPGDTATRAATAAPAAKILFGRYEVVREVATTPHARLIEAIDRVQGEHVAVKVLASMLVGAGRDALLRFEREARALTILRHPHVVALRAYLPEGPAIVLPWMSGGSLADRLVNGDIVSPGRAAEILSAVLGALGEAHRLGILHRDVKPSNILFDDVGTAHLSDFGAAHLGDLSSTATAGAIGTFSYMSPEQRLGKPATIASDLYGAGAVFAELLTGDPPDPASDVPLRILPSEHHPDLGDEHDAFLLRLLDPDPVHRPADAFDARRTLLGLAWSTRILARPTTSARRTKSQRPAASAEARLQASDAPPPAADVQRKRDTWLERDVWILSASDDEIVRARGFARAGHPTLPWVLRMDAEERALWVGVPLGDPAGATWLQALNEAQRRDLAAALRALHAAGGAHGAVDGAHVYLHEGGVFLAYPMSPHPGALDADRDALALIC